MIGVLGGMGPESTAYTYSRMIRFCQDAYGARLDSDFPPILIYSMPIPDVVEEGSDDAEVFSLLDAGIRKLKSAGADFCIIPCNTMQGFVPRLRENAEVLSIVEETLEEAIRSGKTSWGILGTEVTLRKGYFQQAFRDAGLGMVEPGPSQQKEVTVAIREILAGRDYSRARERLLGAISALKGEGAEGIVLACTDLPIVLRGSEEGLLDTADIIARAAIRRYYSRCRKGGP